jgi:hypothetical protein
MKKPSEYDKFRALVDQVLKVPRGAIKAKLDAEKRA